MAVLQKHPFGAFIIKSVGPKRCVYYEVCSNQLKGNLLLRILFLKIQFLRIFIHFLKSFPIVCYFRGPLFHWELIAPNIQEVPGSLLQKIVPFQKKLGLLIIGLRGNSSGNSNQDNKRQSLKRSFVSTLCSYLFCSYKSLGEIGPALLILGLYVTAHISSSPDVQMSAQLFSSHGILHHRLH